MSSPEEIQLSRDLHSLVTGQHLTLDVDAIERRGHHQRQRSLALRGVAGLSALGVAVAGGLVAAAHTGTAPKAAAGASRGTVAASSPRTETVAYVRKRIASAQDPADSLVKTRENTSSVGSPVQMITIWTDPSTGNTMLLQGSGPARVTYWEHDYYDKNRVLHWDQTQVNYGPRTWWTYNEHAAGPIKGPVPPGPAGSGDYTPASQVKALLASKGVKIVGHPVVNGHHTIELSFGKTGLLKWDYWVDSSTYQLVQMEKFFPTALGGPPIKADYTLVPRTAAMTARINHPQVPAGYSQVQYGRG